MDKETISARCHFSASGDNKNTFSGMASVFNNMIDSYMPTRIKPGAFTKTLRENRDRIRVLYQHNEHWPIGIPTKMEERANGLYVEARISATQMGADVMQLMRDGVITELSIGFDPVKFEMVDEGPGIGQVRHIRECRLWEFSPVTFAANSQAKILSVHRRQAGLSPDFERKMKTLADYQKALEVDEKLRQLQLRVIDMKLARLRRALV